MNAFDRAEQFIRDLHLPRFHTRAVRELVKQVVLDAAKVCEVRADAKERDQKSNAAFAAISEARKCAGQIRHNLLCKDGQSVCIKCDGDGCESCELGIVRLPPTP